MICSAFYHFLFNLSMGSSIGSLLGILLRPPVGDLFPICPIHADEKSEPVATLGHRSRNRSPNYWLIWMPNGRPNATPNRNRNGAARWTERAGLIDAIHSSRTSASSVLDARFFEGSLRQFHW